MATIRHPLTPLDGQPPRNLTNLKSGQNASTPSSTKRKATDDFENVYPAIFSKRLNDSSDSSYNILFIKHSTSMVTKFASTNDVHSSLPLSYPWPCFLLNPKSPAARLNNTGMAKAFPLPAAAGRSRTRGKKTGSLCPLRRRRDGSNSRMGSPAFGLSSKAAAPFSLDGALKGTLPSYDSREIVSQAPVASTSLKLGLDVFKIHEDTAEQEMTNLLEHSTCVLAISSDEETETRWQRERAEGKENMPPADEVSQAFRAADADGVTFGKKRSPLTEMSSVNVVPGDDEDEVAQQPRAEADVMAVLADASASVKRFSVPVKDSEQEVELITVAAEVVVVQESKTAEGLMQKTEEPAPCAAVL
ncbi:uncharacterized protein B0I36DRAFT_400066 [Microdochium trichocladiopsis]|uniref:Uncharacterized protein n=1 Tax=Microdochium trichocladiopsis TaxID=1682393 RepID=A0A9P9BFG5_9PEZI|nr:uncharacterized protein B0I36DRAFT_400066 [Microdochium trichocladiopsis]KAH7012105.1 hypothetical protein B0I36DRAFT_400066 [Microdochium trichocladiopsis]